MHCMSRKPLWLLAAAIAACSSGTEPHLRPCTAAGDSVVLAIPGAYRSIDAVLDSGCTVFPANGTPATLEYLVVPQLATRGPGETGSVRPWGDTDLPVPGTSASNW